MTLPLPQLCDLKSRGASAPACRLPLLVAKIWNNSPLASRVRGDPGFDPEASGGEHTRGLSKMALSRAKTPG